MAYYRKTDCQTCAGRPQCSRTTKMFVNYGGPWTPKALEQVHRAVSACTQLRASTQSLRVCVVDPKRWYLLDLPGAVGREGPVRGPTRAAVESGSDTEHQPASVLAEAEGA
jgi:hypothetical protein